MLLWRARSFHRVLRDLNADVAVVAGRLCVSQILAVVSNVGVCVEK